MALGIVEGYWEFRLKPWDVAAGLLVRRQTETKGWEEKMGT